MVGLGTGVWGKILKNDFEYKVKINNKFIETGRFLESILIDVQIEIIKKLEESLKNKIAVIEFGCYGWHTNETQVQDNYETIINHSMLQNMEKNKVNLYNSIFFSDKSMPNILFILTKRNRFNGINYIKQSSVYKDIDISSIDLRATYAADPNAQAGNEALSGNESGLYASDEPGALLSVPFGIPIFNPFTNPIYKNESPKVLAY